MNLVGERSARHRDHSRMSTHVLLEGLGYLASVLIAISLMMRSIVRLRRINLVGSACFTVYGILIAAYPVAALNFAIALINVYFLWKMSRTKEAFAVVEMPALQPATRPVSQPWDRHPRHLRRQQGACRHLRRIGFTSTGDTGYRLDLAERR